MIHEMKELQAPLLKNRGFGLNTKLIFVHLISYKRSRLLNLECFLIYTHNPIKGVFSQSSGKSIVALIFCFLSQRLQILATCLFFCFIKLCKVSARLNKLDIRHFIRVKNLKSLTQKTKNQGNYVFFRKFGRYSFYLINVNNQKILSIFCGVYQSI